MASTELLANLRPIEHRQRWHSENYILPTDNEEFLRLQLQHNLVREMFEDRLVLCPLEIESGDEVLDVGTGTAAWALDFASSYPNKPGNIPKLICIDITDCLFPISPPPGTTFQIANVLNLPLNWTGRFAFVHQRLLIAALKKEEWDRAVSEVFRVTKSGGWAQFCEANQLSHIAGCGPVSARFMQLYSKLEAATGIDFLCSLHIGPIMEHVGFVDVKVEKWVGEVGEWNGKLGLRHKKNMMGVFKGFKTPILRLGGLGLVKDEFEFDSLIEEMEEEWKRPGFAYAFYVITGRKPDN